MEVTIQYRSDLDIVEARASGAISTEFIAGSSKDVVDLAKENQCTKLLIDIRNCIVVRSKMEGFLDMEKFMELTGLSYDYKCAVLYNPATYSDDRASFIETVVRNRPNPRYRMFNNLDDSLKWLQEN